MEKLKNKIISILRWSEKHTKTDMLYLFKGGFWGALSQICLTLMTFGLAVAFAHLVPKETYGQYKYIMSIISLLSILSLTGLGTAVAQSIGRGYEGTMQYAFWKNIKWSIFFFIGAGLTSIYYFSQNNSTIGISMLIAGCLWPFFTSTNLYSSILIAKKDFRRVSIYFDIIGNLVPYICLFVIMFLTSNPIFFVAVYIISNTLTGAVLYKRILSIYKPNKEIDSEVLHYSKHLSFMGILSGIADNIDQILVFHYVGAIQLAVYNFATALPDQTRGPIKSLSNLIFPKFTERPDKEIHSGMKYKFFVLFIISFLTIVIYILIAPYVFKIFFPKYTDSVFLSQIFSLSLLYIMAIPANTYLSAKKKIKEQYIINIFISMFQIIIVFTSIVFWGIFGLIIARVVVRIVSAATSISLYKISVWKTHQSK